MLGSSALSQHAKTVQSLAAEGALLAEDAVAGRTTSVYTREHAAELAKAASREAASLQKAKTDAALEPKLRRGEQRTLGRALNAAAQAGRH
jgi:DNA-binding transcriptional regulator YdaS (Cro superfamily)